MDSITLDQLHRVFIPQHLIREIIVMINMISINIMIIMIIMISINIMIIMIIIRI